MAIDKLQTTPPPKKWTMLDKVGGAIFLAAFLLSAFVGAFLGWNAYWPASYWYEIGEVTVFDAVHGKEPLIDVDRSIHEPFTGEYIVTVRNTMGKTICSGGARVPYDPAAKLPDPITLGWWAAGAVPNCIKNMPPGEYEMTTCVEILHDVPFLTRREVCQPSNAFSILPE